MEDWTQELENYLNRSFPSISVGSVVSGEVVKISEDYVFVDIGLKGEALLPASEVRTDEGKWLVEEGETIRALVTGRAPDTGSFILSFKRLKEQELWETLQNFFKEKKPISVKVIAKIKGGYRVKFEDFIEGFLPFSQSYFKEKPEDPEELIGKSFEVEILKLEKRNFVVSRRVLLEREYNKKKAEVIEKIKREEILEGVVKESIEGGFLVELGGILTGYLPYKELSWQRLEDPGSYLKKGDKIKVKVISFDPVKERIKLSIKALLPDPWEKVEEKYQEGQKVRGKITKVFNFGAFLEVEPGVEGLIPASEISWSKKVKTYEIVQEGDIVEAIVLEIKPSERKMLLSLRKLEPSPWEKFISEVKAGDIVSGKIKSIVDYGVFVELREGISGFVHISNVSWSKVDNLEEHFKVGQEVRAKVLEIDPEKRRIQLSFKHLRPDPWMDVEERYKVGDVVEGVIKKILEKGLVVEVLPEVEAFLPVSELIEDLRENPMLKVNKLLEEKYKIGDRIKGKIIHLEPSKRKMQLSYLKYLQDLENKEIEDYTLQKKKSDGVLTLGELLSKKLNLTGGTK